MSSRCFPDNIPALGELTTTSSSEGGTNQSLPANTGLSKRTPVRDLGLPTNLECLSNNSSSKSKKRGKWYPPCHGHDPPTFRFGFGHSHPLGARQRDARSTPSSIGTPHHSPPHETRKGVNQARQGVNTDKMSRDDTSTMATINLQPDCAAASLESHGATALNLAGEPSMQGKKHQRAKTCSATRSHGSRHNRQYRGGGAEARERRVWYSCASFHLLLVLPWSRCRGTSRDDDFPHEKAHRWSLGPHGCVGSLLPFDGKRVR